MAVLGEHLFRDNFDYFTDDTIEIFLNQTEYPIKLGRQGPEMKYWPSKKIIILDYDDVVNKYGTWAPAKHYVVDITEENSYLKSKRERILQNFKMLEYADDPRPFADALSYDFRKGELTYRQHIEACRHAAENFSMVAGFTWTIGALREMAYRPFILTASPRELLEESQKRLTIEMDSIETSEFYFDSHGIFDRMELNLDDTRSKKRDKILQQSIFTRYGFEYMVDNNPKTLKRIAKMGWNKFYIVAAEDVELMSGNISVGAKELRYDFTKLVDKTKRLERGLRIVVAMSEEEYMSSIFSAHRVMDYGNSTLKSSGPAFEIMKEKFTNEIRTHVKQMRGIFPSKHTQILEHASLLERDKNEASAKIKLTEVMYAFYKSSLEAKLSRNLIHN